MKRSMSAKRERNLCYRSAKIIISVLILFLTLGSLGIGNLLLDSRKADSLSENTCYKYYTSIEIEQDDTLWNIADRYYSNQYQNRNDYIREIIRLNQIDEDHIHSGQYLLVPYFSEKVL